MEIENPALDRRNPARSPGHASNGALRWRAVPGGRPRPDRRRFPGGGRPPPCPRQLNWRRGRWCCEDWCERGDSNPHALRHWNLNPGRLPIPPLSRSAHLNPARTGAGNGNARPNPGVPRTGGPPRMSQGAGEPQVRAPGERHARCAWPGLRSRRTAGSNPAMHARKRKRPAVAGRSVNWWAVKGEPGRRRTAGSRPGRTPRALRVAGPAQQANRRFESRDARRGKRKRPAEAGRSVNWWAVKDSNLGPTD